MPEVVTSQPTSNNKVYEQLEQSTPEKKEVDIEDLELQETEKQEFVVDENEKKKRKKRNSDDGIDDCCCLLVEDDFLYDYWCCRFITQCFVSCGQHTESCCDGLGNCLCDCEAPNNDSGQDESYCSCDDDCCDCNDACDCNGDCDCGDCGCFD